MSAYADDLTVTVLDTRHIDLIITTLKEYEVVTEEKINQLKAASLQLDT